MTLVVDLSNHDTTFFEKNGLFFFVRGRDRRIFLTWTTTVCHSERFNFSDPLRHERPIHDLQYQVKKIFDRISTFSAKITNARN